MLLRVISIGVTKVTVVATSFLLTLTITRLFGAEELGAYVVVTSVVMIGAVVAKWGWDGAAVRFVACGVADRHEAYVCTFVACAIKTVVRQGVIAGLVMSSYVLIAHYVGIATFPRFAVWVVIACTPLAALSFLMQGVLRGCDRQVLAEATEGLLKPVVAISIIAVVYFVRWSVPDGAASLGAFAIGSVLAATAGVVAVARFVGGFTAGSSRPTSHYHEWRTTTRVHGLVNLCQFVISKSPILMGAWVLSASDMGVLAVALRLAESLQLGLTAVGLDAAPRLARLYHSGQLVHLRSTLRTATRTSGAIAIIGATLLFVFGDWILAMFGPEFSEGNNLLRVILIGQVLVGLCGPVGYLATMTGHQLQAARLLILSAVISVASSAFLGYVYGAVGLAIAATISASLWSLLLARLGQKIVR